MRRKDEGGAPKKSKMTVMMFQLEGDDATLQEGFKTIGQAMNSLIKPAYALPAPKDTAHDDVLLTPGNGGNGDTETTETEQPTTSAEQQPTTPARTGRRNFKSPEIIKDLDLKGSKTTLKDFLTQKGVGESHAKRCLAIAVWLKENHGIAKVTADHIYTCYRHMNWTTMDDVLGPIRTLKMEGAFSKAGKGAYEINHIGENRVLEMDSSKP